MNSTTPPEQFSIVLRAEPGDMRPPIIRLRQLLKLALRAFKLRCVAATPDVEGGRE